MKKLFTSESVTEGHPDKLCDRISDAIVDEILKTDRNARCAIECCAAYDRLMIMGEVTTTAAVDYEKIARETIKDIGYDFGMFCYDKCKITVAVHSQSADIARGVDNSADENSLGAGDQGMMFGYACTETPELMPMTVSLSHKLAKRLEEVRKSGLMPYLRPDGKTQVTIEYDGKMPKRVDTVVVSAQHNAEVSQEKLKEDILKQVVSVIPPSLLDKETKYFINPTGRFEIGGPEGDSGLTGRKIIVDTYGGYSRHGGGAFSGKDPTKVDRSAAYASRWVAKNVVAAGLAEKCEIELAYAIGVAEPISIMVDTFGTGKISDDEIVKKINNTFNLTPRGIIETLNLRKPIYKKTTNYGHFGKADLPWEKIIKLV